MKTILFAVFMLVFVSSCSQEKTEIVIAEESTNEIVSEEAGPEEFQPEQIFAYEENPSTNEPEEISLFYSAEPIEIKGAGYTRFVGCVDGLLLIEVAGEGRILNVGDKIGNYVIFRSRFNEIKLAKKGK